MIKFNKIKLKGFKSFVEPTEILIEQGLTGIVGPNGCGKSNLVEAFRFVMGELAPKQMRGDELDDVIFNGTADRPAWDIAEVTLELDNKDVKHQIYLMMLMKLRLLEEFGEVKVLNIKLMENM